MSIAMKRVLSPKHLVLLVVAASAAFGPSGIAQERPTLNVTRDPRPDILVHPIYDSIVPYRKVYNRPRHFGGWLATKIAPSSLEAMVWHENVRAGNYDEHHKPPMYKRYFAPKPWEVLQTGARPDTNKQRPVPVLSSTPPQRAPVAERMLEPIPIPLPAQSSRRIPSDQ